MSDMSNSKEIPREIWTNVARQLRQPLPPAGQEGVTWKDLHQQDLTTMMRVSKTIHLATATVLYSEIVVDNPAGLLKGVERDGFEPTSAVNPEPSAPIHKRHLLAKVRAAHYVYSAADNEPYKLTDSAQKHASRGRLSRALRDLSVRYTDLRRRGPETKDQRFHRRLKESCDFDRQTNDMRLACWGMVFQSECSDPSRKSYWDIYQDKSHSPTGIVAAFEANLAATTPIPVGRYTCQNSLVGPLADSMPPSVDNMTEFNVLHRLSVNQQAFVWSPAPPESTIPRSFVPGIENRLDVSPISNLQQAPFGVSREATESLTAWTMAMTSTHLEFGLTWFAHHVKLWERELEQNLLGRTKFVLLINRASRQPLRDIPSPEFQKLQDLLSRILGEQGIRDWSDSISLVPEDEMPPCPACGRRAGAQGPEAD